MDIAQNCALCQGICVKGRQAAKKRRERKKSNEIFGQGPLEDN
jgi:hypothetical protein